MKVIVAGFPKTGTKTINAALTQLGYEVYDALENLQYFSKEWQKILDEGGEIEDFRRMFQNVDAVCDVPCVYFWEEIHRAFPDAKIIFTQRANEDVWWKSMERQLSENARPIFSLIEYLSPSNYVFNRRFKNLFPAVFGSKFSKTIFGTWHLNELLARKAYKQHNAYVMQAAPKDKTLVFNLADGWEPLCKFLGKEVPDTEFPHENKKGSIMEKMLKHHPFVIRMQREMYASMSLISILLLYTSYKFLSRPCGSPSIFTYPLMVADVAFGYLGYYRN